MFKKPQISSSEKRWLVTFSDLATLLLTFFVMLLGIANVDLERFRQVVQSLNEDRGVKYVPFDNPHLDKEKAEEYKQEFNQMMEQLNKVIYDNKLQGEVSLEASNNGIRLRVMGKLLFDSGDAILKSNAMDFIGGLADALTRYKFFLLVEGHTDSRPIHTSQFPSNWELSGARAACVIRQLKEAGIDPKRLSAIGYADNYPIASNGDAEGRAKNRRVEFIFTKFPTRVVI